jgi:transposase-like protein
MAKYKKPAPEANGDQRPIQSLLDELVLLGARQMIQQGLEAEINERIGRERYERHGIGQEKQYRNGHGKERRLTVGCGTVPIRVPRLREAFESAIVGRYQRLSPQMAALLPRVYLHGLAVGDFQQCFQALLGHDAPLSGSSLVVVGLNCHGQKELLALEEGYRESAESWREVFRDLKRRGLRWIGLVIADGVPGLWKAQRDVFPTARRQRCLVHKMRNVLDKVPLRVHEEVLQALQAFVARYGKLYPKAVDSLKEAGEMLLSYFLFPRQHWKSIKSTNVIESIFAAVKLRTDAARRIPRRDSALYLVFKLLANQQLRWKKIHGYKLVAQTIEYIQSTKHAKLRIAA